LLQQNLAAAHTDVILRLISAADYVRDFSSDRAHMRLPSGEWAAPPPEWPLIYYDGGDNLLDWLDITRETPGNVLTLADFMRGYLSG
jgi:hypothetical protein